jgi:hypothetical protein
MFRPMTALALLGLGLAGPAMAQQPDMAAMQKWMSAPNATRHITGKYEGDPAVSSDSQGMAHVTDVIELDIKLAWMDGNKIAGAAKIKNAPSVVTKPHDREPKCLAPELKGEFDYATLDSVTEGSASALHLKMTRTFPEAVVSQVCSGKKTVSAKKVSGEFELFMPQPTMLAMGVSDKNLQVSPDKKSMVMKNAPGLDGWTWTLTPSPG